MEKIRLAMNSGDKSSLKLWLVSVLALLISIGCYATQPDLGVNMMAERNRVFCTLFDQLPKSSQRKNADSIKLLLDELQCSGVCELKGSDEAIRPICVGLQCLFEEMFLSNKENFHRADFEIHTTMPSTPCCKLPNESAKAIFADDARLATIEGRSYALDSICNAPNATVYLTYTLAGLNQRSYEEQMVLRQYWEPKLHITCIESHDAFPSEVNGATYRLTTLSGEEIFFGIQANQALQGDGKRFTVHLGTKDQPEIKIWLDNLEKDLASFGRTLFTQ